MIDLGVGRKISTIALSTAEGAGDEANFPSKRIRLAE
jgi:hypothetical protein